MCEKLLNGEKMRREVERRRGVWEWEGCVCARAAVNIEVGAEGGGSGDLVSNFATQARDRILTLRAALISKHICGQFCDATAKPHQALFIGTNIKAQVRC